MSEAEKQTAFQFVEENLGRTPFHHWLRPKLTSVDEAKSEVVISLALRQDFRRIPERPEIHGGVIAALIDITAHAAIASKLFHGAGTIDLRVDYLRLAAGSALKATGKVVKLGRTIGVADVQINDDRDRTVAIGRGAYLTKSI
jgi:uncharacterized protein (TIGR00369 family)